MFFTKCEKFNQKQMLLETHLNFLFLIINFIEFSLTKLFNIQ
jgi:hypothetical protein